MEKKTNIFKLVNPIRKIGMYVNSYTLCLTESNLVSFMADGIDDSLFLDNLIKYTCPPCHNTDQDRPVINKKILFFFLFFFFFFEKHINKKIQCLKQLPISWQTVEGSSRPALISPEALQKEH